MGSLLPRVVRRIVSCRFHKDETVQSRRVAQAARSSWALTARTGMQTRPTKNTSSRRRIVCSTSSVAPIRHPWYRSTSPSTPVKQRTTLLH